ncbi:MAG: hypothetical protein SPF50_02260, partial [Oscillospiraceae bacterium]|nr:hypothetical protein [Oscillospiraceae bacterium]
SGRLGLRVWSQTMMKTKKALINQWLLTKEVRPFKQGVRGSNPRWSTKKTDGQKDRLFSFLIFAREPRTRSRRSAVAASGGEPIADSNQSF